MYKVKGCKCCCCFFKISLSIARLLYVLPNRFTLRLKLPASTGTDERIYTIAWDFLCLDGRSEVKEIGEKVKKKKKMMKTKVIELRKVPKQYKEMLKIWNEIHTSKEKEMKR